MTTISALNAIRTGDLSTEDMNNPIWNGRFRDDYTLTNLSSGQFLTLDLASSEFDTYLQLINADTGNVITSDDDGGAGVNSRLSFTAENGINYLVRVTSYGSGATGEYTLSTITASNLVVSAAQTTDLSDNAISRVVVGETIKLSWTVENTGTGRTTSDSWNDYFYLSDDEFYDSSDTFISRFVTPTIPLGAGETYNPTQNITIPSSAAGGNRFLLVWTDRNNNQGESNNDDNILAVPLEVLVPNLEVSTAQVTDTAGTVRNQVTLGEMVNLSWTVINSSSTVNAWGNWVDMVYISDDETLDGSDTFLVSHSTGSFTPLAPGDDYTISRNNIVIPVTGTGERFLLFVADSGDIQGETAENDNIVAIPITVNAPPVVGTISGDNGATTGNLSSSDSNNPTYSGRYSDDYELVDYNPGELVTIELTSDDYNTYLQIVNADTGRVIFQDDDAGQGTDARLNFIAQNGINYIVRATSNFSNQTGNYNLAANAVPAISLPTNLSDGDGFVWDIQQNGSINNGTRDSYDGGLFLSGFPSFPGAQTEENGREVVLGSSAHSSGLEITRKIYVPEDQSWARFLEIVTNVSDVPINYTVDIETNLGSNSSTVVVATSSGDTNFTPDDLWIVTDDSSDSGGDPTLLHVIAGLGGESATRTSLNSDRLSYEYDLTLAPGETQIVMHLAAQNQNRADARAKARNLDLFAGMSASEQQQLVNFATEGFIIDDVTIVEGDNGNITALFTVTLLNEITETVTVDYETVAETAEANVDYVTTNGTLTFLPGGDNSQTISVEIIGDTMVEIDETFRVNLTNANGAVIVDETGVGIIDNDDLIPVDLELSLLVDVSGSVNNSEYNLQISGYANVFDNSTIYNNLIARGIEGSVAVNLILWSSSNRQQESITWTLIDSVESSQAFAQNIRETLLPAFGGARPFSGGTDPGPAIDFATPLFFNNDFDSRRQTIDVSGDGSGNSSATATARDNALAAGIDTINGIVIGGGSSVVNFYQNSLIGGVNADGSAALVFQANSFSQFQEVVQEQLTFEFTPPPQISIESLAQFEGNSGGTTQFVVTLRLDRANNDEAVTVDYVTVEDTATAGEDYTAATGTVTFAVGETLKTVIIEVTGDRVLEGDETFNLILSNAVNGDILAGEGVITILNDDKPDLTITGATANSVVVSPGETVQTNWTVSNMGVIESAGSWVDAVYYSEDGILTAGDPRLGDLPGDSLGVGDSYNRDPNVTIPFNVTPGDHFLLVQTDIQNQESELNENNNVTLIPIEVVLPDLVVNSVTANGTANFGDTIAINWEIANNGTGSALGTWRDRLYLSTDTTISEDDLILVTNSAPSTLVSTSTYNQSAFVTLPLNSSITAGTYYILAQTDNLGQQVESEENNNLNFMQIELVVPPLPDIIVSDITAPVEAFSEQEIILSWTLTNQGDGDATGTWIDRVFLSDDLNIGGDQLLDSFTFTDTLEAGESITRQQVITLPIDLEGNRYVVVSTDTNNQIFEYRSEDNNTTINSQVLEVKLSPFPNLQVEEVIAPPTAFSGQKTVVEWIVTNNGTGATSSPTWLDRVWLSLDQTLDSTDTFLGQASNISYLGVGDSYRNRVTVTLPRGIDGNYYFLVQTDVYNQVLELNGEGDNVGIGSVTDVELTPPPNLQVTAVSAPSQGFSGENLSLNWTVTNSGEGVTAENRWVDLVYMSTDETLSDDDVVLGTANRFGKLNAGDSYTVTRNFALPVGVSGEFYLIVLTDANNQVFEHAFDSNNTGFDATPTTINLTPPPDLEVELVSAPTTASRNLTIAYRVANLGATATPNTRWWDSFYLSTDSELDLGEDLFLGNRNHFGSLNIGSTYEPTATFTLPHGLTGEFHVFVVTDSRGEVFELDKSNNIRVSAETVTISPLTADLAVSSASIPATAEAGKGILVEWSVANSGIGDTGVETWTDRVIASGDAILGNGDDIHLGNFAHRGRLAVGESYARREIVAIPFSLSGSYNLFVVTDSRNQVYEGSEENNNSSEVLPLEVTRSTPDLQVTAVSAPLTGSSGELFTVSYTVSNLGTGALHNNVWYDEVFLSDGDGNSVFLGRVYHSGVLSPGASYEVTRSFRLPRDLTGEYYVTVVIDTNSRVIEEVEDNNQGVAGNRSNITLSPVADLVVETVAAPTSAISGQLFDVTWTVRNAGAAAGSGGWRDVFYLSRDQIFDPQNDVYVGFVNHWSGLSAESSYTKTTSLSIPTGLSGPFYVFVRTDSGNGVYERGAKSNNLGYDGNSVSVILPEPVDLVGGNVVIHNMGVQNLGVPGGSISFNYTVTNSSSEDASGRWHDSIYISADGVWDISDRLLARLPISGGVLAGDSYTRSVLVPIPGLVPGDYHLIVRSDIGNVVPETDEENNLTVSGEQITIDVGTLPLNGTVSGILYENTSVYYRVEVEAGETLRFSLDSDSEVAANELYVRYGDVPSRSEFDFGFNNAFAPDQEVVVPFTQEGTYYILARGEGTPLTSQNYTLSAETVDFEITSLSRNSGGNAGSVTVEILGAKFDGLTEVSLEDNGVKVIASRLDWLDPSRLFATFDLTSLSEGVYDVVANRGTGERAVLEDGFTVVTGGRADLVVDVSYPAATRPGTIVPMVIEYGNEGNIDIASPLALLVSQSGAPLALSPGELGDETSLELLLQDSGEVFGVLPPGATGSITVYTQATGGLDFSLSTFGEPDTPLNWDGYLAAQGEGFEKKYGEVFRQVVGETVGELQSNLVDAQQGWLQLQESELRRSGNTPSQEDYLSFSVDDLLGAAAFAAVSAGDESEPEIVGIAPTFGQGEPYSFSGGLYEGFLKRGSVVGHILTRGAGPNHDPSDPWRLIHNPDPDNLGNIFEIQNGNKLVLARPLNLDYEDENRPSYTIVLDRTDTEEVENFQITIPVQDVKVDFLVLSNNGEINPGVPTYLVTHGFTSNAEKPGVRRVTEEILSNGQIGSNVNVVAIDWREGADSHAVSYHNFLARRFYNSAALNTLRVGDEVAQWLQEQNLTGPITLIGHSLGSHLFGDAATEYRRLTGKTVNTIIGLDSARLFFEGTRDHIRLDKNDADKVIVVHTSTFYGDPSPHGDLDLYVNNVRGQYGMFFAHPGGPLTLGSEVLNNFNHSYAHMFLTRVLSSEEVYDYNNCLPEDNDCHDEIIVDWNALNNPRLYQDYIAGHKSWDVHEFKVTLSSASVEENSSEYTVVGTFSVNQSGDYLFELLDNANGRFRVMNGQLIVANGRKLDYETNDSHTIKVKIESSKPPGRTILSEYLFEINIEDVCDEPDEMPCDDDNDDDNLLPPKKPSNNDWSIPIITSLDPNDIIGPGGFGSENWINANSPLSYTIRFENDPVFATAPAQVVRITQQLDSDLDFRTFRVGDFGFGDTFIDVPENRAFYQTRLDLTEDFNILVDVVAGIDILTGEAFWEFTSVDPATGELPIDAFAGFLPPNITAPEGDGFVTYSVRPKSTIVTGTVIDAEATIVFDINEPIDTPPIFNTLDAVAPTSTVAALPVSTETEQFQVTWSGNDDEGGSAIASYIIYVSDNGSAFTPWLEETTLTEATFVGEPGHTYQFYSVARDNAGNVEAIPTVAQASTQIAGGNTPPELVNPIGDQIAIKGAAFSYTFPEDTFSDADIGDTLTYSATLEDGSPLPSWLSFDGDTRTFSGTPINEDIGNLSITIIATDNEGATATETFDLLTVEEVDPVIIGEVGTVTDFDHISQTINFSQTYNNPVVIAGPLSYNGYHTAIVRIEEVTGNSFTAFIQEPSNLNGVHTSREIFSYLVLEAGTWRSDGTLVEVGAIDTNTTLRHNWETIDFETNFVQTPTIFSHVQSYNDGDFVRTRQREDSADGFQLSLEEEEGKLSGEHLIETVGYVAITPGSGTINGLNYTVGSTPDAVNHRWYNLDFDASFAHPPNFLAQLASYDGPNSAGLRYRNLTGDGVQVFVEEDTSQDSETWHKKELVNFLAIEGGVLSGNGYDPITGMALINGTDRDEILVGTTGDDLISGGSGSDVFVLGEGNDIVSDFTDGVDKIGLTVEFEELTVNQVGGDSVISLGADSLTLTGFDSGLLTGEDFVSVVI